MFDATSKNNHLYTLLGTFNDLDPHQIAALTSCFIPTDKSNEQIHLGTELAKPLKQLKESARRIAEVLMILSLLIILALLNLISQTVN